MSKWLLVLSLLPVLSFAEETYHELSCEGDPQLVVTDVCLPVEADENNNDEISFNCTPLNDETDFDDMMNHLRSRYRKYSKIASPFLGFSFGPAQDPASHILQKERPDLMTGLTPEAKPKLNIQLETLFPITNGKVISLYIPLNLGWAGSLNNNPTALINKEPVLNSPEQEMESHLLSGSTGIGLIISLGQSSPIAFRSSISGEYNHIFITKFNTNQKINGDVTLQHLKSLNFNTLSPRADMGIIFMLGDLCSPYVAHRADGSLYLGGKVSLVEQKPFFGVNAGFNVKLGK
ncbi:MAG: hypothetical protein KBD63_07790 [Bacteriovoracaceae bacterium]|nr:hypothetical protein [Bacteriovoracaceae bacterium]